MSWLNDARDASKHPWRVLTFMIAAFSAPEGVMKPEPSFYLLLLGRLGVEPAGCVYVGDGMDDELEGAKRVGLAPILYAPHGGSSSWPGATIRSLDDAPELVARHVNERGVPG
jgi:putative hydrolase of the HAD superfamily